MVHSQAHTHTHTFARMHSKTLLAPEPKIMVYCNSGSQQHHGGRWKKDRRKTANNIEIASKNTKTFAINRPKIRDQELRARACVCVVSGAKWTWRTQNQFSDSECNSRKVAVNLTAAHPQMHSQCVCVCILSKLVTLRNIIMCNYLQGAAVLE